MKSSVSWFIPVAWWVSFRKTKQTRNLKAKHLVASTSTPLVKTQHKTDEQDVSNMEVEEEVFHPHQ